MRFCADGLLFIFALLYATLTKAIFADEAYQTDYHHALLGVPQAHTTFFHRPSAASKASLLYTLSEKLVLGAVNPKDGAVIWRQQLKDQAQNQTGLGLLKAAEGGDTLISAVGGDLRCWDATDGRLVWEQKEYGEVKSIEISTTVNGAKDVFVLSARDGGSATIKKRSADSGNLLWEFSDTSGDAPYALVSSKDHLYYLSLHSALLKGFKIKVTEFSRSPGIQSGQATVLSSDSDITSEDLILHAGDNFGVPYLVWTDKAMKILNVNTIGQKGVSSLRVPSGKGDEIKRITVHSSRSSTAHPHFLVHYQAEESHWAEVYHVDPSAMKIKKAYDLPVLGGKGAFSASSQGAEVYFVRHAEYEDILFSSTSPAPLSQWNMHPGEAAGGSQRQQLMHAVSEVIPRSGATYAVRSALVSYSGHWELIRNGEPFWTRHEYLTGTASAVLVDIAQVENLAIELAAESQGDPLGAYVRRVKRHIRDLQYLPDWAATLPNRLLSSFTGEQRSSLDQRLRHDGFGFRKIVLIATHHGVVAALDTGAQGKVIWSIKAVLLEAAETWNVLGIEPEEGGIALIRCTGGEFLRLNSTTGNIIQYQPAGLIASLRTSVSIPSSSGKAILVPIKDDGSLGDHPDEFRGMGTIVVTRGDDGMVRGWDLTKSAKASLVWQFLPAPGQIIHSVHSRPSHDPVASIGKALGDRNVLYKYVNPNVMLIATVGIEAPTMTMHLLDSASGAIIYSITQNGIDSSRPIVATIAENWFAYSVYAESDAATVGMTGVDQKKLEGYQLFVSELYESPYPNDRGSLGSSSNFSNIHPVSTEEGDPVTIPHVVTQNFLLPGPISSMSVTSTLQGITTRSILCALPDLNSIMSISRAFINPRRPVGRDPTAHEIEEGLFRYNPLIDFEPKWMITHKRDLLSISQIITSPSLLESTSLVFAFGELDFFGTRVASIGAFDMLGKGFSKIQLILTVVALAIGTLIVAPFVRKKQIDGTWKA